MKFKALPVTSLEDATVDLEQLSTLDILNRRLTFGTATATFSAGVVSATVTVSHGLGVAPSSVLLTATSIAGVRQDVFAVLVQGSLTATQFQFQAVLGNQSVVATGAATVYWLAIG